MMGTVGAHPACSKAYEEEEFPNPNPNPNWKAYEEEEFNAQMREFARQADILVNYGGVDPVEARTLPEVNP